MAIAFDARYVNDQYHGIGRHAFGLLEALTRQDADRRYLVFFHPAYPNSRFDLRQLGERRNVELRPIRLPLFVPTEQLLWPLLLAREKVELFHSPYVVLPLLARIPLLMTIHDTIFERFPAYMPQRWLRRYYNALTGAATRRAAKIFTVSDASRRDIEACYPAATGRVCVTGNGVDALFRRVTNPLVLRAVRDRYRLPDRFILALGAGRPHKNLGLLVDAFASLDRAEAPALVIAGEHDRRFPDDVQAQAVRHHLNGPLCRPGRIRDDDLPALYSLADAFVLPSLVEGFGLPVLEAMACGTPVLASAAASVSEVAGDAALCFDPHSAPELRDQLHRVLTDGTLRADLSRRGLARARSFTWDRVAQATRATYDRVLCPRPVSSSPRMNPTKGQAS